MKNKSVSQPARREARRYRALNPFGEAEAQLLAIINRGEFAWFERRFHGGEYSGSPSAKNRIALWRRFQYLLTHVGQGLFGGG